jgi:hypothetical protein
MRKATMLFLTGLLLTATLAYGGSGDLVVDGNLGVGTTTPGAKLDVNGDIKAGGKIISLNGRVQRDFVTGNYVVNGAAVAHIKTNIKIRTNVMYRILVEGYNYANSTVINSDAVGYTYQTWDCIGHTSENNYSNGASISQYCSTDGYVVIKLTFTNAYYAGFSASVWRTNPNPTDFKNEVTGTVVWQNADL